MLHRGMLESELSRIGFDAPPSLIAALAAYAAELERWNQRMNLTALQGMDLVRRLIIEPIWIGRELQMSGIIADIGSGNGSPAIPLCLTRNFTGGHLIETRAKRVAFLRHIVMQLGLERVVVHKNRVEELNPGELGSLDWVTLQAVALTSDLLDVLRRYMCSMTRVVWITSGRPRPVPNADRRTIPGSKTEIWIFGLDLS